MLDGYIFVNRKPRKNQYCLNYTKIAASLSFDNKILSMSNSNLKTLGQTKTRAALFLRRMHWEFSGISQGFFFLWVYYYKILQRVYFTNHPFRTFSRGLISQSRVNFMKFTLFHAKFNPFQVQTHWFRSFPS